MIRGNCEEERGLDGGASGTRHPGGRTATSISVNFILAVLLRKICPGDHSLWELKAALCSNVPGPRIPPGACQLIFMFERSLQNRVFRNKFQIHWFDGLPFKMSTTYILGSFTNIGYLWERINKGGKVGIFDPGACEVARSLQARLAGSHGF